MTNHICCHENVEKLLPEESLPRLPNLNALRMFDAAARRLNFKRAAQELNLTQGAVAQQVRKLEADLGVKLFHRVTRGLVLTESGEAYYNAISQALETISNATQKLHPESASITLSVTPSFASKWLVPRLPALAKLYPEIEVQTVASESLANFQTDGVDIAIRQGRPPSNKKLHAELLAPLNLCAVCSPAYAKRVSPINKFEDFAAYQLIEDSHKQWGKLFKEGGIPLPKRMMMFNQTALAMDAAANGQGIALAPELLLAEDLEQKKLKLLWQKKRDNGNGYYLVFPREPGTSHLVRDRVTKWLLGEASRA